MAVTCPNCKSPDMQAQLNTFQCLSCGRIVSMQKVNETQQAAVAGAEHDTQE